MLQQQHQQNQVALPANNQGGSISLSMLIDFIVQRTYHDLTVLAELLPRKTDMERKIGKNHNQAVMMARPTIYFCRNL